MRRLLQGTAGSIVLASFIACLPVTPTFTKRCAGALYCQSYSVPQSVDGGTCCVNGEYANASVGYLCAFGANRQPAGCVNSVEMARRMCPTAVAIVRCVAE